jgi:hypothetical protein
LILFVITVLAVGGYFLVRVIGSSIRSKRFIVLQTKALAAVQAANLGWLAVVCGPLLGLLITLFAIPSLSKDLHYNLLEILQHVLLMIGLGAVAGIIGGGAFWVASASLGQIRKSAKRWGGTWDPDIDGLP